MKTSLIIIQLIVFTGLFAQEGGLNIENIHSGKVRLIKENKRIKITTVSSGKLVGRLQIIDEHTIMLRGISLSLSEIKKVKKHPIAGSIGNTVGFLALGTGTFILGALGSDSYTGGEDASNIPLFIGIGFSIAAIYASTEPINLFDKGYRVNKKWRFSIQMPPPDMGGNLE